MTPVVGRAGLQEAEGSWEGQILLSLYFSMLQIRWHKDPPENLGLARSSSSCLAQFCFRKEVFIHEEFVDPWLFARAPQYGTSAGPEVLRGHWNVFTPFYRG